MEYYDEVVEIEDKPGSSITESGVISKSFQDDMELNKPTVMRIPFENFGTVFKLMALGKRSTESQTNKFN